jgi:hypothetical protein
LIGICSPSTARSIYLAGFRIALRNYVGNTPQPGKNILEIGGSSLLEQPVGGNSITNVVFAWDVRTASDPLAHARNEYAALRG